MECTQFSLYSLHVELMLYTIDTSFSSLIRGPRKIFHLCDNSLYCFKLSNCDVHVYSTKTVTMDCVAGNLHCVYTLDMRSFFLHS